MIHLALQAISNAIKTISNLMPEWRTLDRYVEKLDQNAENFVGDMRSPVKRRDTSAVFDPISSYCPSLFPSNATGMFWAL